MDTTTLHDAYRALLKAATTVADADEVEVTVAPGEWNAEQILAHVSIVTAVTIAAASTIASGANTSYDNRTALDTWTMRRVAERAGGSAGLRDRIRAQGDVLCTLAGHTLSQAELGTPVPALLLSAGTVLVDQPMPLGDLITGLADVELPGHTQQLYSLLPDHEVATVPA